MHQYFILQRLQASPALSLTACIAFVAIHNLSETGKLGARDATPEQAMSVYSVAHATQQCCHNVSWYLEIAPRIAALACTCWSASNDVQCRKTIFALISANVHIKESELAVVNFKHMGSQQLINSN